jgi:hypothetical protein
VVSDLYQARDVNAFKRHLREKLSSNWLIVTGDPVCTEDFRKKYYGDSREDVENHLIATTIRDKHNVYTDIDIIMLVRKKRELEEVLSNVERALRLHFKRVENECKARVEYAGVFARLSIARVIEKLLKEVKKTASQRAKVASVAHSLGHGSSRA